MAIYKNLYADFWTDPKIVEDFTKDDRFFYIYILESPRASLCGCYELSARQASYETGFSVDEIKDLIDRFENVHHVIKYDAATKEIYILNYHKYNWTKSPKFKSALMKEIDLIKNQNFRNSIIKKIKEKYGEDTVFSSEAYGICSTVSSSSIVSSNDSSSDMDDTVGKSDSVVKNEFQLSGMKNAEKAWNQTFDSYPKKSEAMVAQQEWIRKLSSVIDSNQNDVAKLIFDATQAYLADYREKKPKDEEFQYIPKYGDWLIKDCDYWIKQVEKARKRNSG